MEAENTVPANGAAAPPATPAGTDNDHAALLDGQHELDTARSLLRLWRLSVPDEGELDTDLLSNLQVTMRGIDELLAPAARKLGDLPGQDGDERPIKLMVMSGLVSMLERTLWQACNEDAAAPDAGDLRTAVAFIEHELS